MPRIRQRSPASRSSSSCPARLTPEISGAWQAQTPSVRHWPTQRPWMEPSKPGCRSSGARGRGRASLTRRLPMCSSTAPSLPMTGRTLRMVSCRTGSTRTKADRHQAPTRFGQAPGKMERPPANVAPVMSTKKVSCPSTKSSPTVATSIVANTPPAAIVTVPPMVAR